MSTPDAPAPAPDAADHGGTEPPTSAPPEPTRRRAQRERRAPRRRVIVIITAIALLAISAVTIGGLLVASHLDREAALDEVDAARSGSLTASSGLREAQAERIDAHDDLAAALTTLDALAAITGPGIDPAATTAITEARGAIAVPDAPAGAIQPAGTIDRDAASADELRAYARELTAYATRLDARAELETDDATALREAFATATAALEAYRTSLLASGDAVLADRDDADADTTAALLARREALATAAPTELPTLVAAYRTDVDAVIASSEKARTPRASGRIGTGIDDPYSLTVVVNKHRGLPADFAPGDLRRPAGVGNALPLRAIAAAAAERMAADMAAVGISLRMASGYRSYARQNTIYSGFVAREGVAGADEHSARPGFSEHQTGLAADFDDGKGCNLSVCFRDTAGGRWLAENAWRYGFILRYGDGWRDTVGYRFEPWHYRFVGEATAADMHERGIRTLEEYFGTGPAADYIS